MKVGTTDDAATKVVCQWRDSSLAWGEDSRVAPPTQTAARGFRRMRRAPCRRDFHYCETCPKFNEIGLEAHRAGGKRAPSSSVRGARATSACPFTHRLSRRTFMEQDIFLKLAGIDGWCR
jgi:hypothetical protein